MPRMGRIVEIEAHNFMTYRHLKERVGARVNLVTGCDGGAKSSFVCAIVVGLAAEQLILGHEAGVGHYVGRGGESGWVKITLQGRDPGNSVGITRKMDRRGQSEWSLEVDGMCHAKGEEDIRSVVSRMNIQVHGLAQFLPQGRMLEIGETTPAQLLQETEEAVPDQQLWRQHASLIEKRACLEAIRTRVRDRESALERLKTCNATWKRLVQHRRQATGVNNNERLVRSEIGTEEVREQGGNRPEGTDTSGTDAAAEGGSNPEPASNHQTGILASNSPEAATPHSLTSGGSWGLIAHRIKEFERRTAEQVELKKRRQTERSLLESRVGQIDQRILKSRREEKGLLLEGLKDLAGPEVADACEWVARHRDEFKGQVYGPILLEVNILDKEHQAYVENRVPPWVWKAFVTQNVQDRDLLQENLKGLNVPIMLAGILVSRERTPVAAQMREMGVVARLDEVVQAPPAVKCVLDEEAVLEQCFLGTSEAGHKASKAHALGAWCLYTPKDLFVWTRHWDDHVSSLSVSPVRPSQLFSRGEVAATRTRDLEAEKDACARSISRLADEGKVIDSSIRELREETDMLRKEQDKILREEGHGDGGRAGITSTPHKRTRAGESVGAEEGRGRHQARLCWEGSRPDEDRGSVALTCAGRLRQILERARRDADALQPYPGGESGRLQELPDTADAVRDPDPPVLIVAGGVLYDTPSFLEEYGKRCVQITRSENDLANDKERLRACLAEIRAAHSLWLNELRALVARMNAAFRANLEDMAAGGEILLDEHDTDYDQYGIIIKVAFREVAELQLLSAPHHSRGQRWVSTLFYLLSLQDQARAPFVAVDLRVDDIDREIDHECKRLMLQQLLKAGSRPDAPQFFLSTPGLPPRLEYSEACNILFVFDGPSGDAAVRIPL